MFILNIDRTSYIPINTVEKCWNIWQIFVFELTLILTWISIVIIFIKFFLWVSWDYHIFWINVYDVNSFCMFWIFCLISFLNFFWLNQCNREVLQHFHTAFCSSSSSSNCKYHRLKLFRYFFFPENSSNFFKVNISLLKIKVFVRTITI